MDFVKLPTNYEEEKISELEEKERSIRSDLSHEKWEIEKIKYREKEPPSALKWIDEDLFDHVGCIVLMIFFPIGIPVFIIAGCYDLILRIITFFINRSLSDKIAKEIKEVEEKAETELKKLKENTYKQISNYALLFEENVEQLIANKFSNTENTRAIVEWLTEKSLKRIEEADRSTYMEKIIVKFDMHVCSGAVYHCIGPYCTPDEFSFFKHSIKDLPDLVHIVALARTLASQVKTNIIAYYDNYCSGAEYELNITYEDCYNSEKVHFIYTEPNSEYKTIKEW